MGVGDDGLSATAIGDGDASAGNAHFEAAAGTTQLVIGNTRWTAAAWSIEGQAQLDTLPALQTLARRIGPSASFDITGVAEARSFDAHAETPFLALDLEGQRLTKMAHSTAPPASSPQQIASPDVARESPFPLGAARLEGELRAARGTTAIRGTLDAQQIDALGQRTRFTGPIEAALTSTAFTLSSDLRAPANTSPLFAHGRLRTALEYNRRRGRFELSRSELTSDAMSLTAQGWANGDDGEFSGEWRARKLEALAPDLRGEASGSWRAFRDGQGSARVWAITADGQGARIDGAPAIVPQLLGASPTLDTRMRYENGGITVTYARVEGSHLRAGATGRIVQGEANLSLEASARGPLDLGGAEIAGTVDATGRLDARNNFA
ncbi:MAG: hypothetical protein IPG56_15585 [Caulobacteraceae bacterium]|nr:hypothetical protein [Caulobacteraceae bacterium]